MQRLAPFLLAPLLLLTACSGGNNSSASPIPAPSSATPALSATATPVAKPSTPTATATPRTAAIDPKTAPYLDAVARQTQSVDDSIQLFLSLLTTPNLSDAAWRRQVVLSIVPWKVAYQNAQKLDPPACLAASNRTYLAALESLDTASADVTQSLMDQSQLEVDATKIEVFQSLAILQQAANEAKSAQC